MSLLARTTAVWLATSMAVGPALALTISELPPEESQGIVSYRTGGVGDQEAAAMQRAEASYPLSLQFVERALPHNEFLPYAEVRVRNQSRKTVLQIFSDGPFVLLRLPDGSYTVDATENGRTETQHVSVATGEPQHLVFTW